MFLQIVIFLLFGLVVAVVAGFRVAGKVPPGGWPATILASLSGAMAGGLAGGAIWTGRDGVTAGFILALLGAIGAVTGYQEIIRRRVPA